MQNQRRAKWNLIPKCVETIYPPPKHLYAWRRHSPAILLSLYHSKN